MEYIVILLLVALLVVLYFKQPQKLQGILAKATVENLRKKEAEIVQGLYNSLPDNIKEQVDSKTIAEVASFTLGIAIDVLEEAMIEEKKTE